MTHAKRFIQRVFANFSRANCSPLQKGCSALVSIGTNENNQKKLPTLKLFQALVARTEDRRTDVAVNVCEENELFKVVKVAVDRDLP